MKTMTLLKRLDLTEPDSQDLVLSDVLKLARRELGYQYPRVMTLSQKGPLTQSLGDADICPFDPETLKSYERSKVDWINYCNSPTMLCLLCLAPPTLIGIFLGLHQPFADKQVYYLGILAALICTFVVSVVLEHLRRRVIWRCDDIESRQHRIPEFALETAVKVKQRVPNAQFFVATLDGRNLFLGVKTIGEEYTLELWSTSEHFGRAES